MTKKNRKEQVSRNLPQDSGKFAPPNVERTLPRPRLFKLIDQVRTRPVLWISGPPGAGKTTLAASYLSRRKIAAAWYRLDASDADLPTFFFHLALAVQRAAPRFRKSMPLLSPEYAFGVQTFALRFFNEASRRLGSPAVLVLDDYQEVDAASPLNALLADVFDALSDQLHVVILSRLAAPAALARPLVHGRMADLDWPALQLDDSELRGLAKLLSGRRPDDTALEKLRMQTHGWTAGVILLQRRPWGSQEIVDRVPTDSRQTLFNYFAAETFDRTPMSTRQFLLETAFLPTISTAMAEELTQQANAEETLADFVRSNYFTMRVAGKPSEHQFHPMFRDFLLDQAAKTLSVERRRDVQSRAARVLHRHGQTEAAIALALQAEDASAAIPWILESAPALLAQGRHAVIEKWIGQLPAACLENAPWLEFWSGMCLLPLRPAEARAQLEKVYRHFEQDGDRVGQFLAWVAIIEAIRIAFSDFGSAAKWVEEMLALLERDSSYPDAEIEARVAYGMTLALAIHPSDPLLRRHWMQRAEALALQSADLNLQMQAAHILSDCYCWLGAVSDAGRVIGQLRVLIEHPEITTFSRLTGLASEIAHAWLTARFDHALAKVDEGLSLAQSSGVLVWNDVLLGYGLAAAISADKPALEKRYRESIESARSQARLLNRGWIDFITTWAALVRGDRAKMALDLPNFIDAAHRVGLPFAVAAGNALAAAVYYELGRIDVVEKHLDHARDMARRAGMPQMQFLADVTEARLALDARDEDRARAALARMFEIARAHGFVNTYNWHPPAIARVCAAALERNIENDYVKSLIRRRRLVPEGPPHASETWPFPFKIYTLGRFELVRDDQPITHNLPAKPLELLKALIAFGARDVPQERLTDALWADAEGDAARRSFDTTLHRLRKVLGPDEALVLSNGRLSLDPRRFWIDVWAFERELEALEALPAKSATDAEAPQRAARRLRILYRGPFLADDRAASWLLTTRERLHARLLASVRAVGRYWEERGMPDMAIACYEDGVLIDPLIEHFYQRLIHLHAGSGRRAEALQTFERCEKALRHLLNVAPSAETVAARRTILERN